jgi:hypothetical protein
MKKPSLAPFSIKMAWRRVETATWPQESIDEMLVSGFDRLGISFLMKAAVSDTARIRNSDTDLTNVGA